MTAARAPRPSLSDGGFGTRPASGTVLGDGLLTFRDPDPRKDVILVGLEEVEVSRCGGGGGGRGGGAPKGCEQVSQRCGKQQACVHVITRQGFSMCPRNASPSVRTLRCVPERLSAGCRPLDLSRLQARPAPTAAHRRHPRARDCGHGPKRTLIALPRHLHAACSSDSTRR